MIKFFRKIRQNMIKENKFSKYLLYAIGEILLVVIGILIALGVSRWNNESKDRETEQKLLYELSQGIKNDKQLIKNELLKTNKAIADLKKLDSLLKYETPEPGDDVNILFGTVYGLKYLRLNSALYEDLKSVGLGIVHDDKLRSQIIQVFETHFSMIEGILENERSINQLNRPYYLSNFSSIRFSEYAKPIDIEKLWSDPFYKNIVHYRIVTLEINQKIVYEKSILDINLLLELIDKNLKI
jgi:uncharacterized protein DUF6090